MSGVVRWGILLVCCVFLAILARSAVRIARGRPIVGDRPLDVRADLFRVAASGAIVVAIIVAAWREIPAA